MIISIKRDTGEFIELRESESKDFRVLADFFARCTLPIWEKEVRNAQTGTESELALKGEEEIL